MPSTTEPAIAEHLERVSAEVAAETRSFNTRLEEVLSTQPSVISVPPELVRAARRAGSSIFPAPVFLPGMMDIAVPGRAAPVRLRVAHPASGVTPRGVYLHIHGGGWMFGAADFQDPALVELANAAGVVVASVEYRLAPEHPYPAGVDDCEDAARWLLEHGAATFDTPARFSIGGESAGAHLAVLTLLRLGRGAAFSAANLVFGAFDLSMTPSQRAWGDRNLVLSTPIIEYFCTSFVPGRSLEDRRAPHISPLYADLRGLPPALFTVGTIDPLLDDSLLMAKRWHAAGGRSELRVWPDAVHAFTSFPLGIARLADAAQLEFIARAHRA